MSKEYKSLIFAGVLAVVSVFYLVGAWNIKLGSLSSSEGRLIPKIAGFLLLFLCLIEITSSLRSLLARREGARFFESLKIMGNNVGSRRVAVTLCLLAGYVVFLPSAGFLLTTFFFLLLQTLTLCAEWKKLPLFLAVSLLCSFAIYYVFVTWFELLLPSGILG